MIDEGPTNLEVQWLIYRNKYIEQINFIIVSSRRRASVVGRSNCRTPIQMQCPIQTSPTQQIIINFAFKLVDNFKF